MASFLEQRRKSLNRIYKSRGGTGISKKSSSTSSSVFDPKKQIENYTTRLENIGQSKEDATDTRNWLEKKLNLKKDQNVLFDIFELIGRPQQALFGREAGRKRQAPAQTHRPLPRDVSAVGAVHRGRR